MTSSIRWELIIPFSLLMVAGLAVLAVLLFLDWRRSQRFRAFRIACQVLAVMSVLGILLRPTNTSITTGRPMLLLTEGFTESQADSLLQAVPGLTVYRAPGVDNFRDAMAIEGFRSIRSL